MKYMGKDLTWLIAGVLVIGILIGVVISCAVLTAAMAEDGSTEMWVICQPDSYVNVRERPSKKSQESGRVELGDRVETDGARRNGFLHIVNASTESGDGWVAARYLVEDMPVIETYAARICGRGRVAVRQYPGGKRTRWLKPGQELTVYAISAEWAVTNRGFICSDYVESE